VARAWAERVGLTLPVLLDSDGGVAEAYAPEGVLPELPRNQVPIASNLIIDREGRIRFYELLDSRNFDSRLIRLRARLDALLAAETPEAADAIVAVASPADLVLRPGQTVRARVHVTIDPAHHVMANPASEEYFVPLSLEISSSGPLVAGPTIYPAGVPFEVDGMEKPLATYEGAIVLTVPVTAAPDATPGRFALEGTLAYQACGRHACLIPSALPVRLEVEIR